ncbi:hypothetical protein QG044_10115, partial [Kingella kingae]
MNYKNIGFLVFVFMQSFSLFFVEITQEKLIEIINMTISYSGTVFTINGIWIAILFPEIFIKIYKENEQL